MAQSTTTTNQEQPLITTQQLASEEQPATTTRFTELISATKNETRPGFNSVVAVVAQ